ncbi:MAG TPA: T9SS type A sorting domain-containing protein [Chitinivibrionales bacterium]|jgi:hypothetical protein|nr:T9SS type A sorting domain-containing protein [Chitinivibrionales bacterium]
MKRKTSFQLPGKCLFITALVCCITYSHAQIKARITASQSQLAALCGTAKVKVVFACGDSLYFVDFSATTPQISKMNLTGPAYLPVISSDGNWIAYQTGDFHEGPSASQVKATAWIRELAVSGTAVKVADTAYVPRFVQNTSADTPEIVYATSVACPQNYCYTTGQTVKKKIVSKSPGSAEVVFNGGSYYGGLSWDNRYLNSAWDGGPNAFMLDLQGGTGLPQPIHTMRVKKNGTNIDTFVTVGACNPSRSASRIFTNTMMYYDFSSLAITAAKCFHPLLGTWGEHQLLFISRYDAEDLRVYNTPAERTIIPVDSTKGIGEAFGKEWHNPEWSNHPYYAVSGLSVDREWLVGGTWYQPDKSESIYLIDLKDSLCLKLIESTDTSFTSVVDFQNPFLWVEVPAGFQEDTTWLAKTIWERAGQGVINPYKPALYPMPGSTGSLHTEIAIYSLAGKKLASVSSAQDVSVFIREKLHALKSGTYLVVSTGDAGQRQIYRWVNVR